MKASILVVTLLATALPGICQHSGSVTIVDRPVRVNAGKVRTLDVEVSGEQARIVCSFEVVRGSTGVRVLLVRRGQEGASPSEQRTIASSDYARRGALAQQVAGPGEYRVVLENRQPGSSVSEVDLMVRVTYGEQFVTVERRRTLIAAGFGMLGLILMLAGAGFRRTLSRQGPALN